MSDGDAREYLKLVVAELAEREAKLAALDAEIRDVEYRRTEEDSSCWRRRLLMGDAGALSALHERERTMRQRLEELKIKRAPLAADVERARARKQIAEEELEEEETASADKEA